MPEPALGAQRIGSRLSPRQLEILRLLAKGLGNKEVASVLGLSVATVRTHLEHTFLKFDVDTRIEAVVEGIRRGLVEL